MAETSRPSRKRNQTKFYFEEAVKELEASKAPQKKRKLDAFSSGSEEVPDDLPKKEVKK